MKPMTPFALAILSLAPEDATDTQSKHVHSPTYEAVTKPIYTSSVARWRNYAKQLEPHVSILQPFIDEFGYA